MPAITAHCADMRDWLAAYDGEPFDACVTDPPYHLTSIVQRFGSDGAAPAKAGKTGAYQRASRGFMGKTWDGGGVAFEPETWAAVLRVLKPGAHLIAFSGTRTFHRMACAIEDAGFEIRDQLAWLYGSGFPKSHDVSKGIDRMAGAEREKIKIKPRPATSGTMACSGDTRPWIERSREVGFHEVAGKDPATPEAAQWEGWGSALKPAFEPICLARKPLAEPSIAANVLAHGTGALNIDGCRIEGIKPKLTAIESDKRNNPILQTKSATNTGEMTTEGRWPANVAHDGSEEVLAAFPDAPGQGGSVSGDEPSSLIKGVYGERARVPYENPRNDSGSAARFFYSAKAGPLDRIGTDHPTVKPVDLMRWLCRMITPPGGRIIEPFAGSGKTGIAALAEGFGCTMLDIEPAHVADIERQLAYLAGNGALRVAEHRQRGQACPTPEDLPLFAA